MKQVWERFMRVKGCLLEGVFANKLDTYQVNKEIILHSVEPLLYIRNSNSTEIKYWKMDWTEDNTGEDILQLIEQETPESIEYDLIDIPNQKHLIMGSSFSFQHKLIKKVIGYGYKENHNEILSLIVLELDELFICINTGPVIEMKITNEEPTGLGDILFST